MTSWPVGRRPGPSTVHSRRPAGGRPAYGRRTAGLRPAWRRLLKRRFLQTRFLKTSFFVKKKSKIWKIRKFSAAILCFCKMHFSWKIMSKINFVSFFVKIYVFEKCVFFMQKNMMLKFAFKNLTLFFPTLGSGRKNKVRPWRLVKRSARLSLLKLNQTCVQKLVFGKSMCTFLQCRTLVT